MKLFKSKTHPINLKNKTWRKLVFGFFILFFSVSSLLASNNTAVANDMDPGDYTQNAMSMNNFSYEGETMVNNATANGFKKSDSESCSIWHLGRCLILIMFDFAGWLLMLSSSVFAWMIDTDNIKYIISDNTAIYSSWTFVRDILNMAFIMVLLFSAFCTIFRIEQYNYKKLLWKIVLMALLVNFSFPIARFIIDVSNILMYTLISNLFGTSGTTGTEAAKSFGIITGKSGLGALINGGAAATKNLTDTALLANAILIFMLAITFLAIGVLLLVRIIALAILIIFSPLAFTGSIMPGVSSYASQWWDNLFKYSFFGPIMIFGVSIAVKLMNDTNTMTGLKNIAQNAANSQVQAADAPMLAQIGIVIIPIILLWITMGIAQKLSIAGAGAVMGAAKGAMKWTGKLPWRGIKKGATATGIPGGIKQAWNKRVIQPLDRSRQKREAYFAGKLGDKTAAERNMKTRASEYEKNNESESDLKKWAAGGDAAAAYTLASRGKIDQKTFGEAMNKIKDDRSKQSLVDKAEDTRMDVTLQYKLDMDIRKAVTDPTKQNWVDIKDVAKAEYGNLTADGWSKQKNLTEHFKFDPVNNPNAADIEAGAKAAFHTLLDPLAKIEALKRMNGKNSAAIT